MDLPNYLPRVPVILPALLYLEKLDLPECSIEIISLLGRLTSSWYEFGGLRMFSRLDGSFVRLPDPIGLSAQWPSKLDALSLSGAV